MRYDSVLENGQGLMEYALILVFIALVVIGAILIFGPFVGNLYSDITNMFPS